MCSITASSSSTSLFKDDGEQQQQHQAVRFAAADGDFGSLSPINGTEMYDDHHNDHRECYLPVVRINIVGSFLDYDKI
jgi:hypothetical protein